MREFLQRHRDKASLSFAYALLFAVVLATQIGAFTHGLSHLSASDARVNASDADSPLGDGNSKPVHQADAFCALCSVFAATHGALPSVFHVFAASAYVGAVTIAPAPAPSHPSNFPFSSRAPPALTAAVA